MNLDRSKRWRSSIFAAVVAALIFMPLFLMEVYAGTKGDSDFPTHLLWAMDIKSGRPVPAYVMAHSAWQFLVLAFNTILGLSSRGAELISILLCVGLSAGILTWWFWPTLVEAGLPLWRVVVVVLGLNIAAPVALWWFSDHELYLGYVGIISYHNPTIIMLRPLALLQFMYALRGFSARPVSKISVWVSGLVSLLSTFAKPNLAICLLPALVLLVLFRLIRKERVNLLFLVLGILIPTAGMLAWQFLLSYHSTDSTHVIFAPFGVIGAYSHDLAPKFLLSILFPLLVKVFYWKQASHNLTLVFAWLVFIFGAFFTYFVAESSIRFKDGNFTWSGEIALFLLFAAATLFFLSIPKASRSLKWSARALWILQVDAGVVYYIFFTLHILYIV